MPETESKLGYRQFDRNETNYVNSLTGADIKMLEDKQKEMKIGETTKWERMALIPIFVTTCLYGFLFENNLPNIILTLALIIFSLFLMLFLFFILKYTNASSISAMVAQRYNRISYCVTILIVCYATFVSTCLLHRADRYTEFYLYTASLSAILSALILIFPLPVKKNLLELGFRPIKDNFHEKKWDENLNYKLKFYPRFSRKCQKWTHYMFIGVGLIVGWISVLTEMVYNQDNLWLKVIYLGVSVICVICFICSKNTDDSRSVLYSEYLGLHFYILGLALCIYDFDI